MALIFLAHALIEGGAGIANIVGLLTGKGASAMFPNIGDAHGLSRQKSGPFVTNIPLAIGAALYHYAIVAISVFRLLHPDALPLVGPLPEEALPMIKVDDARLYLGLMASVLHIALASFFTRYVVEASDEGTGAKEKKEVKEE
ncbi:hypothetical protein BC829DRAFT_388403 [Chytridium lagenaria]|nr:hypothetical protein BC829DRAFT_388403 [Chytridium lagenaria]